MILLFSTLAWASPLLDAARLEMNRALEELSLPEQPAPYWIGVNLREDISHRAFSSNGALFYASERHHRSARIDVRVGDRSFDNRNFNSLGNNEGIVLKTLPTEDNEIALRRELWLGFDNAYKGALEAYAEKSAAYEGRDYTLEQEQLPIAIQQSEPLSKSTDDNWTIDLANQISADLKKYSFLEGNLVVVSHKKGLEHILTSEGHQSSRPTDLIIIRVEVETRAEDGSPIRNLRSWVVKHKDQLPSIDHIQQETQEMVEWLKLLQTAPIEEDYLGPVIFEPDAAVELFRQLLLPQLSATPPPAEPPDFSGEIPRVIPTSRIGRRVLPENWSIIDNAPAHPEEIGSYPVDQDGVPPQRVDLVKDGVVTDLLMSRIPRDGFTNSTGHARSIGRDRKMAINTVTLVSPPKNKRATTLQRKGLHLAKQTGQDYLLIVKRVEPLSLTDNFEIAFSGDGPLSGMTLPLEIYRLYTDGRKEPVRGSSFVGVDRRVLRDIAMAGEQSEFIGLMDDHYGRYGLGYAGGILVSWSAPSVLISEMEIRGQGGQELRVLPNPITTKQ